MTKEKDKLRDASEDIDVNMAGLSLTSSVGETSSIAGSSLHISSPGPANATVQTVLRDVSQQDDPSINNNNFNDNDDAAAQSRAMNEHRPSIVALKMSLKEVAEAAAAKRLAYQTKGINSAMNSSQRSSVSASSRDEVFVDASPVVNRTPSIDIPRPNDNGNNNGQKHFYNGVKSSNHFAYHMDESNNTPLNVDPDAGMLQGADVVLNQELLEKALKRDMKRKRTDTMLSSTVALSKKQFNSEGRENSSAETSQNDGTVESTEPMSATAAMMMRLYGDPTLMEQQKLKTQEEQNKYVHNITNAAAKKIKSGSGKRKILSNPNLNLQPLEPLRPVNELGMFSAQKFSNQGKESNPSSDKTNVILKWRDDREDSKVKEAKIYLVSREICASLQNREQFPVEYIQRNEENFLAQKVPLEFDSSDNDWYVPNLYLPPGIYRFQFLVNGNLRHSNFLPTATDEQGNIVNWFEVLRGYERIEPYRDEHEIQSGYTSSADTTLEGNDSSILSGSGENSTSSTRNSSQAKINTQAPGARNQISRNSSYYSAKSIERPFTPYSDYTGISRSNSIVGGNDAAMMNRSLTLDFLPPPTSKTYSYSNKIPALFKISGDSDDEQELESNPRSFYNRPSFTHRVVDCNQDALFGDLQKGGKMDAEEAENLFLKKYAVPDLPVYLNSSYLNKIFHEFHQVAGPSSQNSSINHIIPHVNLKHLLTSSIKDGIVSVACTTRYAGKFITQVIYAPCDPTTGGEVEEMKQDI